MNRATPAADGEAVPKIVQLDDLDRAIVRELRANARIPNNLLASRIGVAPSTCLARVRQLERSGVITGYHAAIDESILGRSISALVAVRVTSSARQDIKQLARRFAVLPRVRSVFFLAGDRDFLIEVACASPDELRDFVTDELSIDPVVAHTQTSLVFEHITREQASSGTALP